MNLYVLAIGFLLYIFVVTFFCIFRMFFLLVNSAKHGGITAKIILSQIFFILVGVMYVLFYRR
jgi:hypothetical protein